MACCGLVNGLYAVVEFCKPVYVGCADADGNFLDATWVTDQ